MNSEILKLIDDELIFKKRRLRNMLCSLAVPVSGGGRNMISYEGSNYYPVNFKVFKSGLNITTKITLQPDCKQNRL